MGILKPMWWPHREDGTLKRPDVADSARVIESHQPQYDDWGNIVYDQPPTPYTVTNRQNNGFAAT